MIKIKNYKQLIKNSILRKKSLDIIQSSMDSIETEKMVKRLIKFEKGFLKIKNQKLNLRKYRRIFIIGFGKASGNMARGLNRILGRMIYKGIVLSNKTFKIGKINVVRTSQPLV